MNYCPRRGRLKMREHPGIAEENLKLHTVKTYVNVQTGMRLIIHIYFHE